MIMALQLIILTTKRGELTAQAKSRQISVRRAVHQPFSTQTAPVATKSQEIFFSNKEQGIHPLQPSPKAEKKSKVGRGS